MPTEPAAAQPNRQLIATGFGPWGRYATNASQELLAGLDWAAPPGWDLARRIVPVSWVAAHQEARRIAQSNPAAVVAFGQFSGNRIRIERRGVDSHSRNKLDVDSLALAGPATDSGRAIATTLPCATILERLRADEIPCQLSDSAGDFLCNFFLFRLLAEMEACGSAAPIGFIHIPSDGAPGFELIHQAAVVCLSVAAETAQLPPRF